jgi:hypothetical protein
MRAPFTPHFEVLPAQQRRVWPGLRPMARLGFVLYGGTAVALRLGNRQSVDFDFFSDRPLDKAALRAVLMTLGPIPTLQDRPDTLSVSLQSTSDTGEAAPVNISFFGGIRFGRVGEPDITSDGVLQVASLLDLMATKLAVITQRAEAKDYRDLTALLRAGMSLPEGLGAARALYGASFQPTESLRALTYFGDGNLDTLGPTERAALARASAEVRHISEVAVVSRVLSGSPVRESPAPPNRP